MIEIGTTDLDQRGCDEEMEIERSIVEERARACVSPVKLVPCLRRGMGVQALGHNYDSIKCCVSWGEVV